MSSAPPNGPDRFDAVIVGAGLSGLYMLYRLRDAGMNVCVLEQGDAVGGTWYWNRYPGARCDVDSLDYCYSFSDALLREWRWTERFATQPEILSYINHVADRFNLRRHIRFETRVVSAIFDENTDRWSVKADGGVNLSAKFCIMATGCLSKPTLPAIPGVEDFKGAVYHTATWPHEPVDFTGKTVGIIGTGSSACQAIPLIASQARELYVFQRTPNHCVPANNHPLAPEHRDFIMGRYPELLRKWRGSASGTGFAVGNRSAFEVDPQERERVYACHWEVGGSAFMLAFDDILLDERANDTAADFVRRKIHQIVTDPVTAGKLEPVHHPLGTKRICLVTNYYESFNRDNVHLVELRGEPIQRVKAAGVTTSRRSIPLDAMIYATGFDAISGSLLAIDIRGRGGVSLRHLWADGPCAYLGLMVAGLPNFFTVTGPGSPSVISNMMSAIEQHVEWITACIDLMRAQDLHVIETTPEAERAWMKHVDDVAQATLYPRARSWYSGDNIEGKPRLFTPYVAGFGVYSQDLRQVVEDGYSGFMFDGHGLTDQHRTGSSLARV